MTKTTNSYNYCLLVLFITLSLTTALKAQQADSSSSSASSKARIISILKANLSKRMQDASGESIRMLIGQVHINDDQTQIYCDSAVQFLDESLIKAYGNIYIKQPDQEVFSDSLSYYLDSDYSRFEGRVILIQDSITVLSQRVDYFKNESKAVFPLPFHLVEDSSWLYADRGVYFNQADSAQLAGHVLSKNKDGFLSTDSLLVSRKSGRSYSFGRIYFEDAQRLNRINSDQLIAHENGYRWATANVRVMKIDSALTDTMHLKAQEIEIIPDSTDQSKEDLFARNQVEQWQANRASIADTLTFLEKKEQVLWFGQPTLWQDDAQIKADTILLQLRQEKAEKLVAKNQALHIQPDSISSRFNQIQADSIIVFFNTETEKIKKIVAEPSSQIIYQSKDDQDQADGLISLASNAIYIFFDDEGKAEKVESLEDVDGAYFEEEAKLEEIKLPNFIWDLDKRPSKPTAWPSHRLGIPKSFTLFSYPIDFPLPESVKKIWEPNFFELPFIQTSEGIKQSPSELKLN